MPYVNGKRVTNEQWIEARSGPAVGWREATGYVDGSEAPVEEATVEEAPKQKRRARAKRAEVEQIVNDVTGLDITLAGDDDEDEGNDVQ